jgi:chloramphenicol-sensitive protein RarD
LVNFARPATLAAFLEKMMDTQQTRQGIFYALGAYFIWGIAPAYFKLVKEVPPTEIMTHRVIWSALFMLGLITLSRSWRQVRSVLAQPKKVLLLALTALTIGGNWLLFIWAVNNQHMLEASLGYFINPLINVVFGMLFLRERFRRLQWLAVLLAATGVLVQLWQFGSLPIIGLGLALSFALYGLVRKKIQVDAQSGMLIETAWLFPLAAIYLFGFADSATSHLSANPLSLNLKLIAAGIITTIPLMLFAAACARLRLSTVGFFQYLGPTLMFLLAVLFYGESLTPDKMVTFGFIWLALAIFILDALLFSARTRVRIA